MIIFDYETLADADKHVPIESTIKICNLLRKNNSVEIWSDLPASHMNQLMLKLRKYLPINKLIPSLHLRGREMGDTTPWHELKEKWLLEHMKWPELPAAPSDKTFHRNDKPEMVFERSGSLAIDIWKKYGVPVMEVHV